MHSDNRNMGKYNKPPVRVVRQQLGRRYSFLKVTVGLFDYLRYLRIIEGPTSLF